MQFNSFLVGDNKVYAYLKDVSADLKKSAQDRFKFLRPSVFSFLSSMSITLKIRQGSIKGTQDFENSSEFASSLFSTLILLEEVGIISINPEVYKKNDN